jgi:hypothetical protein
MLAGPDRRGGTEMFRFPCTWDDSTTADVKVPIGTVSLALTCAGSDLTEGRLGEVTLSFVSTPEREKELWVLGCIVKVVEKQGYFQLKAWHALW